MVRKKSNRENHRMKNKWQTVTELDIYLLTREQGKKEKRKCKYQIWNSCEYHNFETHYDGQD